MLWRKRRRDTRPVRNNPSTGALQNASCVSALSEDQDPSVGARRLGSWADRFPYAVYYKVDDDVCVVFRVLDCRQEPEKTAEALK
jgi:hypothetical protein